MRWWTALGLAVVMGCGSPQSSDSSGILDEDPSADEDANAGTDPDPDDPRGTQADDEPAGSEPAPGQQDSGPRDPDDMPGPAPAATPDVTVDPAVAPPAECDVGPGRVGLQRLTRSEYDRTVRDLFGVGGNFAVALPPDSTTSGFDNNASSLSVSPQSLELWLDVAESVAREAMANQESEIVTCDPDAVGFTDCGRQVLTDLALRVYRRPALDGEIDSLMRFVDFAEAGGESFATGIEYALAAMLTSPQFLYKNVPPTEEADGVSALDDYALATRLSYFLWGSTPDAALLDSAGQGTLRDTAGLRAEFDRMLADSRASALYDGFFSQWLLLGKLGNAWPDPSVLPNFSDEVRAQMLEETRLFFTDVVARDGSALEFINGRRTFANDVLADIYGLSTVTGSELVQVDVNADQRTGVLTMPAILTMTSDPSHTNIVRRGSWVAESILCAAPPPPPENVPPLPDAEDGETERERLERHRADPVCAPCHDLIDPLGFPFEHYDAVGRLRDTVDGEPVDAVGRLPDGRTFDGVLEMVRLLEGGPEYKSCVTQKLMTYALGRTASNAERCIVSAIGEQAVAADSKFSDLLWAIVTSDAFQRQEAEEVQ